MYLNERFGNEMTFLWSHFPLQCQVRGVNGCLLCVLTCFYTYMYTCIMIFDNLMYVFLCSKTVKSFCLIVCGYVAGT